MSNIRAGDIVTFIKLPWKIERRKTWKWQINENYLYVLCVHTKIYHTEQWACMYIQKNVFALFNPYAGDQ